MIFKSRRLFPSRLLQILIGSNVFAVVLYSTENMIPHFCHFFPKRYVTIVHSNLTNEALKTSDENDVFVFFNH